MKIIQLKIFFFFFFIYVKGQSQTTDSTVATITYKTVAYKDAKKVNSFYDISILKIGKISSRFFSRNNLDNESTIISIAKTNPFNGNIPMLKPTFPQDVEKYYTQDNFVIVEQLMTGRYGVRFDTSYNQEWKIDTVSKFIGGLKCIKAETIFKNRKYIVFFAPEIPITNGPWIFSGLPGLILEAFDTDRLLSFSLEEIKWANNSKEIFSLGYNYKLISKEDFVLSKEKHKQMSKEQKVQAIIEANPGFKVTPHQ